MSRGRATKWERVVHMQRYSVGPAFSLRSNQVFSDNPCDMYSSAFAISHAIARFKRVVIVGFDTRHQALETSRLILRKRTSHTNRVQPLATITVQCETLVHVHVFGIEMENQVMGI